MDFAWLKKKTPSDRKDLVEKEASMSELIETTMQSVKRIATELRPGILDHLGLAAAVEWQAEEFEKRTGIKCSIVFSPDEIVLDRDRSTAVFRVFQETLTNIARHAKATKVSIGLTGGQGEFHLCVKDNGKGITEKQISDRKSLGLIRIRERVYFWGGSVTITGSRMSGTEISVRIPLAEELFMIKLLIADDHAVVRKGIKQILAETPDIVVADEAGNGDEIYAKLAKKNYDMLLLDISMPGKDGLEILKELKRQKPSLAVLMLSMFPEEQYAVRALKSGASGYLTKDSAPDELIAAIRKVNSGGKYVSAFLAEKLADRVGVKFETYPHERLSDREFQVLCMIASGKTVKQIGEELSLSIKTVSTYRMRLLEKMEMKNNSELTRYALENKLAQ